MDDLKTSSFKRVGTPEYVLAKAGLVKVVPQGDTEEVRPTPALDSMFENSQTLPLTQVVPLLNELVKARAYETSGILDASTVRIPAISALRELGMTNVGIGQVQNAIAGAEPQVKQDIKKSQLALK